MQVGTPSNEPKIRIIALLGGDAFLSSNFFRQYFRDDMGARFWSAIASAVGACLKKDPSSKTDASLPERFCRKVRKFPKGSKTEGKISLNGMLAIARSIKLM